MDFLGADEQLFMPLTLGGRTLQHRVVMAPMPKVHSSAFASSTLAGSKKHHHHYHSHSNSYTKPRHVVDHVPSSNMAQYYGERATPGGLVVTEGASVSERAGNDPDTARIDIPEAAEGWKRVVQAVHSQGGVIAIQLNHCGRAALATHMNMQLPLSSSNIPLGIGSDKHSITLAGSRHVAPRMMDMSDMLMVINEYIAAARNAVQLAGADFVEINAGDGYLLDQFFNNNVNNRDDEYGGTVENRAKFPLWLMQQVCAQIGANRVGVKVTPYSRANEVHDTDTRHDWQYIIGALDKLGLAYIHMLDPQVHFDQASPLSSPVSAASGSFSLPSPPPPRKSSSGSDDAPHATPTIAPFLDALQRTPVISSGGWDDDNCRGVVTAATKIVALGFGEWFASNPDLPHRLQYGMPLTPNDDTELVQSRNGTSMSNVNLHRLLSHFD